MATVKWIKIVTNIFDDEKMLLIDSLPEADAIIVIWFRLLCLAGKQNNGGVFMLNDKIAYTDEMLAAIFRRPLATVRLALSTFEQFGMIEIINNTITIPNWGKHQSLDQLAEAKEKTRQRVAAHRERQKALAGGNVTVTECNAVDIDKEIDKDIEKEKDKEKEKKAGKPAVTSFDKLLDTYSKGNAEVKTLLGDWLKVRKAKRAAMTDRAIELNLKKLDGLAAESGMTVAKYLEEVICRGWSAFYKINDYSNPTPRRESTFGSFDTDEFFDLAAKRSQPKTAGEDASIRERAEALKKQFTESKAEPAATVDAADSDLLTQLKEMYGAEK